jgi:predicted dehydrogenase
VWVEKPLALGLEDLRLIESTLAELCLPSSALRPRRLMVGFNRRFAPMAVALRKALAASPGPRRFVITVNAGRMEPDHWTLDPRTGGGRIVGEGCHFVDLLRYLAGSPIKEVHCIRRDTDGQDGGAFEVSLADGSSGLIDYRTDLPAHLPKEIIEVSGRGYSAQIRNWSRLTSQGLGGLSRGGFWSQASRKGHPEAMTAFLNAVHGGPDPIPFEEILEVSRWSIEMQAMRITP